ARSLIFVEHNRQPSAIARGTTEKYYPLKIKGYSPLDTNDHIGYREKLREYILSSPNPYGLPRTPEEVMRLIDYRFWPCLKDQPEVVRDKYFLTIIRYDGFPPNGFGPEHLRERSM
ncbi:unnamed protein product, partial [Discosporangium mesarthrocarpum]